mgnify:CR=1 FL=1
MSAPATAREIHLVAYPKGMPTPEMYKIVDAPVREPGEGEILMRVIWMSVDPYMRGRMNPHVKSYIPPFQLNEPLDGGAVGQVVASNNPKFAAGDYVVGFAGGWREYYTGPADGFTKVDPAMAPLSAYLGALGMPGITAWVGLTQILEPKEGDVLFVSGAAGAVGSMVGQLGKIKGCKVIGSAGSPEKCQWLTDELGFDVALNYKDYANSTELTKALATAAGKGGVDCYFENVGGMHLEAALNVIAFGGRIAMCGMIAGYNATAPEPGPYNLMNVIGRGVKIQGFIVSNYMHLAKDFYAEAGPLLAAGKIHYKETVYYGLENAPAAFNGLFEGANTGKAVVRVGPDSL